jgi:hypothetical protein
MSKSNHQKHGFKPAPKFMRKYEKEFKTWPQLKKTMRWNGDDPVSMFANGTIGRIENIRWVEV